MKISVMQPYVFPYIGYYQLIRDADVFVVFDDVSFRKRSWISRNKILLNNSAHLFSLHLHEAGASKKINEIEIGDNREKLLKTFRQAYCKAPYFREVMPFIEDLVRYPQTVLALYLAHQLEVLSRYMGLHTRFILSSTVVKDDTVKGQEKVLAICDALGATNYSNAIGGQHLYSETDFAERGIELRFIQSHPVQYRQFNGEFIPWLSIIDVLMFNSQHRVREFLNAYERVPAAVSA